MIKSYVSHDILNRETHDLSIIGGRFEIHGGQFIRVEVRCRENSRVYRMCQQYGFVWC